MTRGQTSQAVVAAAVCYRRRNGVELLLVRTRGGGRWTFPKGHVRSGEAPHEAAAREAREEAGVAGIVEEHPVARYLYPSGSDGGGERSVAAYLLEVSSQGVPAADESNREPTWFSPATAVSKLSEGGREERYGREHARVVEAALSRLGADAGGQTREPGQ